MTAVGVWSLVFVALILLAIASFASGLLRPRYRIAPLAVICLIIVAYVTYAAITSAWATKCWNCTDEGAFATRGQLLSGYLFLAGMIAIVDFALIWMGTRISQHLGRKGA